MKRVSRKNNPNLPSDVLARLEEIVQTLSPGEWERRLRHLQEDISDRQALRKTILDSTTTSSSANSKLNFGVEVNLSTPSRRHQSSGQSEGVELQFRIASRLLRSQASPLLATRAGEMPTDVLLVAKNFTHQGVPILVQAWLAHLTRADAYNLRVVVQSMPAFSNSSHVDLRWGTQEYTKPLMRGKTVFSIARPDFSQELALTLQLTPHEPTRPPSQASKTTRAPKRVTQRRAKKN